MVTQILNFGLPAPIDIQIVGNDLQGNRQFADNLLRGSSTFREQRIFAFSKHLTSQSFTLMSTGQKPRKSVSLSKKLPKIS